MHRPNILFNINQWTLLLKITAETTRTQCLYDDKILFLTEFIKVTTPSPPAGFEPATYRLTAERSAN